MAANNWDNSTADGLANTAANWSRGNVPTGTDVATFLDAVSSSNCLFDVSISCAGIDVQSTYSGNIDMATFNLTTSSNMTFDGSGIFDCGTGTLTCSGDFDYVDQTTFTSNASTIVMDGASTLLAGSTSQVLNNLTISNTTELGAPTPVRIVMAGLLSVSGTLTLSKELRLASGGDLQNIGTINGASTLGVFQGASITTVGTIACNQLNFLGSHDADIAAGQYDATNVLFTNSNFDRTFKFKAGTYIFTGDVVFNTLSADDLILDLVTNNPAIEFRGDVSFTEGGGPLTWSKGTGTVTFGGTTIYTDSTAAIQVLGDVDVDGTSLQLATEMECDDFTLTSGAFDINGQTLDSGGHMDWASGSTITDPVGGTFSIAGNFTADGQDISGASGTWFLQIGGTAVASGAGDVANSDASGFTTITATTWTSSGSNSNWDFGTAGNSWYYQAQLAQLAG